MEFSYLGFRINVNVDCGKEIKGRLAAGLGIMGGLDKVWKSKDINMKTKLRLFRALVWLYVTYGCEAWTLRKEELMFLR